jgi:hypothetical protein
MGPRMTSRGHNLRGRQPGHETRHRRTEGDEPDAVEPPLTVRKGRGQLLLDHPTVQFLQRAIGNRSVQRLVTSFRGERIARISAVIQRDPAEVTRSSIGPEYASGLAPEEIIERINLLDRAMAALQARGERHGDEYSALYNNRRILRDALGDLGRTVEQEMIASVYRLPPLNPQDQARVRLVLGGTRAYEVLEHREALNRQFNHNQRRGWGIANFTQNSRDARGRADQALERELALLGVSTPQQLADLVRTQLPRMVLARAKVIALGMLDHNERIARREKERYGGEDASADVEGLRSADTELAQRFEDVTRLQRQVDDLTGGRVAQANQRRGMGIANFQAQTMAQLGAMGDRLATAKGEYEQVRRAHGQQFPILLAKGYRPGMYRHGTTAQIARRTSAPLETVLDNIDEVREEIADDEMKVWHINRAVTTAMIEMGVAGQPDLVHAVTAYVEEAARRDAGAETFKSLVMAALSIATTIAAGPLAPIVGGAWAAVFAADAIDRYSMESAAENVALDPEVRDISANEPDLLWLVVELAFAVVDVGAALRALRPLARSAMVTGSLTEFSAAARRVLSSAPDVAESLIARLRRQARSSGGAAADATRAAGTSGAGRTLDDYLGALKAESHGPGSVGGRWDHPNQPRGLADSRWEPGLPIDMPNTRGNYPAYDVARARYWRNRAHFEQQARRTGRSQHAPGNTLDPVKGLTDEQLETMSRTGRAPAYAYAKFPGQTWELEHGVPQRVGEALTDLGLSRAEAARLTRASDPGNLMEVTPLEHAFFDAEAHSFGRARADASGRMWPGTVAADARLQNYLVDMSDAELRALADRTRGLDFTRTPRTRELRNHLRNEITGRGLPIVAP